MAGGANFNFFVPTSGGPTYAPSPDIVGPSVAASQMFAEGVGKLFSGLAEGFEKKTRRQRVEGALDSIESIIEDEKSFETYTVTPAQFGGIGKRFLEQSQGDAAAAEAALAAYYEREQGLDPQVSASLAQEPFQEIEYQVMKPSARFDFERGATDLQVYAGVPVSESRRGMLPPNVFASRREIEDLMRAKGQASLAPFEGAVASRMAALGQGMGSGKAGLALAQERRREEVQDIREFGRAESIARTEAFRGESQMRVAQRTESLDEALAMQTALDRQRVLADRQARGEEGAEAGRAFEAADWLISSGDFPATNYTPAQARTDLPAVYSVIESVANNPQLQGTARGDLARAFLESQAGAGRMVDSMTRLRLIEAVQAQGGVRRETATQAVDDALRAQGIATDRASAARNMQELATFVMQSGEEAAGTADYLSGQSQGTGLMGRAEGITEQYLQATEDPEAAAARVSEPMSFKELIGELGGSLDASLATDRAAGGGADASFVESAEVRLELHEDGVEIVPTREDVAPDTRAFLRSFSQRHQGELRELATERAVGTTDDLNAGELFSFEGFMNSLRGTSPLPGAQGKQGAAAPQKANPLGFGLTPAELRR